VDSFPGENSKSETEDLLQSGGGPAANAAYLLSSWGDRCAFAGLIGDDSYGRRVREEFQSIGTDISLLELRPGHATPVSMIIINKRNGSRTVVNRKVKGGALRLDESALRRLSPRVLLFDGHELEASMTALRAVPDAVSILDAGSLREGAAQLAGCVDYLAASERFAVQATEMKNLGNDLARRDCVARLRKKYSTTVIVTLGEHGLVADDGGGYFHLPAYPAKAVDTTAAGDIFHGAFAHTVAEGMAFRDGLSFSSMSASLSVRVAGGRTSIPTLKKVKEELARVG
jgi:sugar/nucleoside kinase (ribokinase family)